MKMVGELTDSRSGSCYLIGKGASIDAYQFKENLPMICINDSCTAFPGCDYVISGNDQWSRDRLNGGFWDCAKVRIAQCLWGKADYYYNRQNRSMGNLRNDALFCEGSLTATCAISLCKMLGFSSILMLGFGDCSYARRWDNLNYRVYDDQSDFLLNFAGEIGIQAEILMKLRIKDEDG